MIRTLVLFSLCILLAQARLSRKERRMLQSDNSNKQSYNSQNNHRRHNHPYGHNTPQKSIPDYYAILGVEKDANNRVIRKAWRKLISAVRENDRSAEEKEAEMTKLNEAYEILSDEELRKIFDRGGDPRNPEQSGNPFGGGQGFPFPIFVHQSGNGNPFQQRSAQFRRSSGGQQRQQQGSNNWFSSFFGRQ